MKIVEKIIKKQQNLSLNPAVTIALLGDSVTQGCFECYTKEDENIDTVFDADSSYGSRLKSMLNLLYPTVQFNFINAGISGDSAKGGLKRLERDVLSFHPDLVIVGFALNDAFCIGASGINEYKKTMAEILTKIAASGAESIVLTPNAMNTNVSCHLKEKPLLKLAKNMEKVQKSGVLESYAEAAKAVAAENGAVVCDVYSVWKSMIQAGVNVTELLANKLNHPVRQMHYLTAMMLCECILR
ncbi:MAG: GDSL family lipase [Clostridia bacterium]|nr:GDSL family lipase [Clostridia bacterium]